MPNTMTINSTSPKNSIISVSINCMLRAGARFALPRICGARTIRCQPRTTDTTIIFSMDLANSNSPSRPNFCLAVASGETRDHLGSSFSGANKMAPCAASANKTAKAGTTNNAAEAAILAAAHPAPIVLPLVSIKGASRSARCKTAIPAVPKSSTIAPPATANANHNPA